ncbi:hypothetical protein A3Q32_15235 [Alcanivorax sp. KX64203]|nr:hypothetical protein A3Q32_15235 [Alcanivorax sp. KX64203]|tara:strand:- start:1404 stop:1727 length:324 start_codon:yes stop_codon:yes gene_type:complete
MASIPERDWKALRSLKGEMLNEACERILRQVESMLVDREGREHERYLELWKLLREEDEDIALMFDNLTRNHAYLKLLAMRSRGVLSDERLSRFSEETRKRLQRSLED